MKDKLFDLSQRMQHLIEQQKGSVAIHTEDYGWDNYRYSSPKFRLAHVERYFMDGLLVVHVTCFPNENNPAPIYGFDIIASEKSEKIVGAFLDWSPVAYDIDWNHTNWSSERILPEWASVFSGGFIAIRPSQEEYDKIIEYAYESFERYFSTLNETADDLEVKHIIREVQNEYCEKQSMNPRTFAALSHKIGENEAKYFMKNILFPKIN